MPQHTFTICCPSGLLLKRGEAAKEQLLEHPFLLLSYFHTVEFFFMATSFFKTNRAGGICWNCQRFISALREGDGSGLDLLQSLPWTENPPLQYLFFAAVRGTSELLLLQLLLKFASYLFLDNVRQWLEWKGGSSVSHLFQDKQMIHFCLMKAPVLVSEQRMVFGI